MDVLWGDKVKEKIAFPPEVFRFAHSSTFGRYAISSEEGKGTQLIIAFPQVRTI
jgi:hypothetical protein